MIKLPDNFVNNLYLLTYNNGNFLHELLSRMTDTDYKQLVDYAIENHIDIVNEPQSKSTFVSRMAKLC